MNRPTPGAALAALILWTGTPLCHAGGPAFTGIFASADSAETVYNNPAGMTRLDSTEMTGKAILVVPLSQFEVDGKLSTESPGRRSAVSVHFPPCRGSPPPFTEFHGQGALHPEDTVPGWNEGLPRFIG